MLTRYIQLAMNTARYETLPEDSSFCGEIPDCIGVYAKTNSLESCRTELKEVLEEWILLRVAYHLPLPIFDGIELTIKRVV